VSEAVIDGIRTYHEVIGSGPPLLMFSPGGFDARLDNWTNLGHYRGLGLLDGLRTAYRCIAFDRRDAGRSGGRVERVGWADYAAQGTGLLDHFGIERAHLIGGCAGCSVVLALAVAHPERVASMILYSPAGGVKYRRRQHARFDEHLAFVREHGLGEVVTLARGHDQGFGKDARVGPWAAVLRSDPEFAARYAAADPQRYGLLVGAMARLLFDRDTVPGAEPEDLMALDIPALIVPGEDDSHAPSAARYLQECLPDSEYWDTPVSDRTADTVPPALLDFLKRMDL
jgi:pimeloyl-ACP methyl ester carboxylesterase